MATTCFNVCDGSHGFFMCICCSLSVRLLRQGLFRSVHQLRQQRYVQPPRRPMPVSSRLDRHRLLHTSAPIDHIHIDHELNFFRRYLKKIFFFWSPACTAGRFGSFCSQTCSCPANVLCDRVTGECVCDNVDCQQGTHTHTHT